LEGKGRAQKGRLGWSGRGLLGLWKGKKGPKFGISIALAFYGLQEQIRGVQKNQGGRQQRRAHLNFSPQKRESLFREGKLF